MVYRKWTLRRHDDKPRECEGKLGSVEIEV